MTSRQEEAALTDLDLGNPIELGMMVKEGITGFTGTAVARSEWLWGCVSIAVLSGEHKDGKPVDEQWFDEGRLSEVPGTVAQEVAEEVTGGPTRSAPSR
ncbi:hypothetical protein LCGC14_0568010 [marine sediment metagenome]|uniref:Uncharacterized protein n=1 Tax=marine sediment metagenome TaxID=412755 RepID=A0A0F9U6G7_9ZZZZ